MIISELLIVLFRVSLHLGSDYSMTDDQMNDLFQTLGIFCRQDYYQDIKDSVISKIDVSFSITKYENYVADKVLSFGIYYHYRPLLFILVIFLLLADVQDVVNKNAFPLFSTNTLTPKYIYNSSSSSFSARSFFN